MQTIDLTGDGWRTAVDFYESLLSALGAPSWHGKSVDALVDSVIWGGINKVGPPLVIRIKAESTLPREIRNEIQSIAEAFEDARNEYRDRHGRDVDVQLEVL